MSYLKNNAEHQAYNSAKQRCINPNHKAWSRYGARGILFKFTSFENFITEIGPKPSSEFSLEREDNNKHYEVGNVKWATRSEQMRNRRNFTIYKRAGRGYTWNKQRKLWIAMIFMHKTQVYLGGYAEESQAKEAYEKAKKELLKEGRWPLEKRKLNKK
jgi:hypothetical protein